jgi:hypothetical protein
MNGLSSLAWTWARELASAKQSRDGATQCQGGFCQHPFIHELSWVAVICREVNARRFATSIGTREATQLFFIFRAKAGVSSCTPDHVARRYGAGRLQQESSTFDVREFHTPVGREFAADSNG